MMIYVQSNCCVQLLLMNICKSMALLGLLKEWIYIAGKDDDLQANCCVQLLLINICKSMALLGLI